MKKRIVTLCLALALCLSLTVGGFAAFSDEAAITDPEAVSALHALGVIEGLPDGRFDPDGTLTRAQMAQIAARLLGGGSVPVADAAAFADVPADHWAYAAVAACRAGGIIDGVSADRFDPNGTLTARQCAKMLLVIAGYGDGLTGSAWAKNTDAQAAKLGLYDALPGEPTEPVTRQQLCRMALTCLDAEHADGGSVRARLFPQPEPEPEPEPEPDPADQYLAFRVNIYAYVLTEPYITRVDGVTCTAYTAWTIHGRLNILETGPASAKRQQGDCIVLASNNDGLTYCCTSRMIPVGITVYEESDRVITLHIPDIGRDYLTLKKLPERFTLLNVDSTRVLGLPGDAIDTVDADSPWVNAYAYYSDFSDNLCIIYDVTNEWDY